MIRPSFFCSTGCITSPHAGDAIHPTLRKGGSDHQTTIICAFDSSHSFPLHCPPHSQSVSLTIFFSYLILPSFFLSLHTIYRSISTFAADQISHQLFKLVLQLSQYSFKLIELLKVCWVSLFSFSPSQFLTIFFSFIILQIIYSYTLFFLFISLPCSLSLCISPCSI